jgi:Ser/Thr protein kinase RdoA (MazF antagonist)
MTPTRPEPAALLVHGMGAELVRPDWAPLADDEVGALLARYPGLGPAATQGAGPVIIWRSPRPMSAAALIRCGHTTVFVKRHDPRVRTPQQLAVEHAFAAYLADREIPVPMVLQTENDGTAPTANGWVYEVHAAASGIDLYRDAMSWTPFTSLGHARTAGAALASLHLAAAGFPAPARPPAVLTNSCAVIMAPDPIAAVADLAARRSGLARYLRARQWQADLARHVGPATSRARPYLARLPRCWAHGDWHASNLTWTSTGPDAGVAAVLDLGLANRTFAAHDLALALERSTVSWLDLAETGTAEADLDQVDALLDGYSSVRRLTQAEAAAVARVLPVVHIEHALSEIEYFADVVHSPDNADLAYDTYLIGHARWFTRPSGGALLEHLRRRAADYPG